MKKYIVSRAFFGFCVGVTLVQMVVLLLDFFLGAGSFQPVIPQLLHYIPNEHHAACIQTVWSGCIGVSFAEASLFFEMERWGRLKQYTAHLLTTGIVYFPFVLMCYLPLRFGMAMILLGNILFTYGVTYTIQYIADRRMIARINAELERRIHGEQY